mgnify:CR=1 FL=1
MDNQDKAERRELARKMALARTKPVIRKSLAQAKSEGDSGMRAVARRGNMLAFTGDEANGL